MEAALLVITRFENWIYALLVVAAAYYIRLYVQGMRSMQATLFGIEKEQARAKVVRALALMFLLLVVAVSVYFTAHLFNPAGEGTSPLVSAQRSLPTVVYGTLAPIDFPTPTFAPPDATPQTALEPAGLGEAASPLALTVDGAGCLNPQATLTYPTSNTRLRSTVEVTGTADIRDFAFYKFEIAGHATGGQWVTLTAGDRPVVNGRLGVWDTSALSPGLYALRLVVVDRAGLFPLPCVVAVEILPPPG